MLKFVKFLQKRPSDVTIRSVRGLYAATLAAFLGLTHADYALPFATRLGEPNATYAEFALAALVLVPGLVAAFGLCVAKRKYVRLMQLGGSVFLFVLAASISPVAPAPAAVSSASTGSLNASDLVAPAPSSEAPSPIDVSGWLKLLAILPLLSAITGKMVTEKCLKHGEVIKKIRV